MIGDRKDVSDSETKICIQWPSTSNFHNCYNDKLIIVLIADNVLMKIIDMNKLRGKERENKFNF